MRTVFEDEEEEVERPDRHPDPQEDREVTLSSTTLLAIFFGLVLVCALFFGLGYTVGRRGSSETAQLPSSTASTSAIQSAISTPKPSAAAQPAEAPAPPSDDAQTADATGNASDSAEAKDVSAQPAAASAAITPASQPAPRVVAAALPVQAAAPQPQNKLVTQPPASSAPSVPSVQQAAAPAAPAAASPGAAIMVQIAAISNPADADVLVNALKKRGYAVTARRFAGDPLIHVQVGPFSNRADANAMKQKLLGDGYNAFLK